MSWLRKRTRELHAKGSGPLAFEHLAREFAERACRKLLPVDIERWAMDQEEQARLIAEALAAADKEETP